MWNLFLFFFEIWWVPNTMYLWSFSKKLSGVESWYFWTINFWKLLKHKWTSLNRTYFWKSVDTFALILDWRGILVFLTNQIFESFRFPKKHKIPSKYRFPPLHSSTFLGDTLNIKQRRSSELGGNEWAWGKRVSNTIFGRPIRSHQTTLVLGTHNQISLGEHLKYALVLVLVLYWYWYWCGCCGSLAFVFAFVFVLVLELVLVLE